MSNAPRAPEGPAEERLEELVRPQLQRLYPLNRLDAEAVSRLLPAMYVERYPAGVSLYRAGDAPPDVYYLLQGAVCLYDSGHQSPQLRLTVGSGEEMMPLPLAIPAEERAVVDEEALILHIERALLLKATAHDPRIRAVIGSVPATARVRATTSATGLSQAAPPRASRVLLVEHEDAAVRACRALLRELGLRHDWVGSAEEAIEVLRLEHYGAVLLDLDLPAGDCFDVVKMIRTQESQLARPRIIALAQAAQRNDSLVAGIDEIVSRPLSMDTLAVALGRVGLPLRLAGQRIVA